MSCNGPTAVNADVEAPMEAGGTGTTTKSSKSNPPAVITVDTGTGEAKDGDVSTTDDHGGKTTPEEKTGSQARTPKHANKGRDDDQNHHNLHNDHYGKTDRSSSQPSSQQQKSITPERPQSVKSADQFARHGTMNGPPRPPYGGFSPPRPYEGRPLGGSGAFQPHDSARQGGRNDPHPPGYYNGPPGGSDGRPPMHVSPSHANAGANGDYRRGGPPGYFGQDGYHHRGGPYPPHHPPYGPPHPDARYDPAAYPQGQFRGPYPPRYPPGYAPPPGGGGEGQSPNAWGHYHHGRRPPPYPQGMPPHEYPQRTQEGNGRYPVEQGNTGGNTFSRAVSSSFGSRSDEKPSSTTANGQQPSSSHQDHSQQQPSLMKTDHSAEQYPPAGQHHSHSSDHSHADDSSWGQLNQVASVDEAVMRERMEKRPSPTNPDMKGDHHHDAHHHHHHHHNPNHHHPASNSSSLTNSPTEGHESKRVATLTTPSKLTSLDSLSSVASAQEPLTTSKEDKAGAAASTAGHLSPGSSASLDLMKCSSGSSGLLHLTTAHVSFPSEPPLDAKRTRDEARSDADTTKHGDEACRAPSDSAQGKSEERPTKRGRTESEGNEPQRKEGGKYKASPLSISCSPPASPGDGKRRGEVRRTKSAPGPYGGGSSGSSSKDRFMQSPGQLEGSYFDKAPSYTYSMDSAPPFPKDNQQRSAGYPPLPHRPGSSSSSTITPMQVEGHDNNSAERAAGGSGVVSSQNHGVGPSLPSWEIQQQDSFSGGSAGGGAPLMSSFSFTQDYPMLSGSGSNLGCTAENTGNSNAGSGNNQHNAPPLPPLSANNPTLESRNQSFEGGHYHGSFSRTESMDMSYGSRPPPGPYQDNYKVQHPGYIPHAPSWGSHGPPGAQGHYGQYNPRLAHSASFGGGPPMMRNYSEERVSPPPGPPGMRMGGGSQRSGFQPPPEFMAPHNPHLARRPQQAVYLMSSPSGHHGNQPKSSSGSFSWSKDDDIRLSEIMKKYKNPRDWEPIAKEHGRGKT